MSNDTKLADASTALREAETARDRAQVAGVQAVRALEAALVAALEGSHLRGCKNLGTHRTPFAGFRVRGEMDGKVFMEGVEHDAEPKIPPTLCVAASGRLVRVCYWRRFPPRNDPRSVIVTEHSVAAATDADLFAEDAELLAGHLVVALARHMELAREATVRYDRLASLAERVQGALVELK